MPKVQPAQAWKLLSGVWISSEPVATRTQLMVGMGASSLEIPMLEVSLYRKAKPRVYAYGEDTTASQKWCATVEYSVRALTDEKFGVLHLCHAAGSHGLGSEMPALQALLSLRVVEGSGKRTPRRPPRLVIVPFYA